MRLLRAMETSTVKPPYNGTARDRIFFCCRQVQFNSCFRYSQVPLKTSLYVELNVKIRSGMKSADVRIALRCCALRLGIAYGLED